MREVTDYIKRGALEVHSEDVVVLRSSSLELDINNENVVVERGTGVTTVGITLASPVGSSGRKIFIKNGDNATDTITITAPVITYNDGTPDYQSLIDGASTTTITTAYGAVELLCDGQDFHIRYKS